MKQGKVGVLFFWLLEVNLILWFFVAGYLFSNEFSPDNFELQIMVYLAIAGFLLAACLQHWAYYNIYKPTKQSEKNK